MKDKGFPRWCAPLFGLLAGMFCAAKAGANGQIPIQYFIGGGAIIGTLAGCLIFLLDPAPPAELVEGIPEHLVRSKPRTKNPSGVVGRFLALAGVLLCWAPFLGLILNVIGWFVNRKSDDWAKRCSTIGCVIGGIATAWVGGVLIWESLG